MIWKNKEHRAIFSIALLIIVYLIGIIGFFSPLSDQVVQLSFYNLIFSCALLLFNNYNTSIKNILYLIFIYAAGMSVEIAGVKTGLLFGQYSYGETLGLKVLDVPLIMGLNWLIPIYCVGIIGNYTGLNSFYKSLIGAGLMVSFDLLLEPVAIAFDFWNWENGNIPLVNYTGWFLISFFLLLGFHKTNFKEDNMFAPWLFSTQFVFFAIINIFKIENYQPSYFLLNAFSIFIPLIRSFEHRINYVSKWKTLFYAILLPAIPFIAWDITFTRMGVWGFNQSLLLDVSLLGLPIEEWLFFIVTPYASLFIYENIKYFIKTDWFGPYKNHISISLMVLLIGGLSIGYQNTYTVICFSACLLWILINHFYLKPAYLSKLYFTMVVVMIPFILFDGVLTGSFGNEEIVWYDNNYKFEYEIMSIPIEDLFYCILLIGMNINLYEYFGKKFRV